MSCIVLSRLDSDGRSLVKRFVSCVSFEPRSPAGWKESGVSLDDAIFVALKPVVSQAKVSEIWDEEALVKCHFVDRTSVLAQWDWIRSISDMLRGHILLDITCFTRELLGMLIYALSLRAANVEKLEILYTPPESYSSQWNPARSLSQGVTEIRSVLGFPGVFEIGSRRHLIALSGHEDERLLHVIREAEPSGLTVGQEFEGSSTCSGFLGLSQRVQMKAIEEFGPEVDSDLVFFPDSIHRTYKSMVQKFRELEAHNLSVVAMNSKLSFVGVAFAALACSRVRLLYAVPRSYDESYSAGAGVTGVYDCTDLLFQHGAKA